MPPEESPRTLRHRGSTPEPAVKVVLSKAAAKKCKTYTMDQVREHNTRDDCWIVVEGKVYNITKWLPYHPGRDKPILGVAGRDVSEEILVMHPPMVWEKMLPRYYIGDVIDYKVSESSRKFRALYFQLRDKGFFDYAPNGIYYGTIFVWCAAIFTSMWLLLINGTQVWHSALAGVLCAFFWQQSAFVGHDLGHDSITGNVKLDRWIGIVVGNSLWGTCIGWWRKSHDTHHVVTNSIEHDPDIQHLPFLAVTEAYFKNVYSTYHERVLEFNLFSKILVSMQHNLYYLVMSLARFFLYVQTVEYLLDKRNPIRLAEGLGFAAFLSWYAFACTLPPTWAHTAAFFIASHLAIGLLHVQITLNHFSMPCDADEMEFFPRNVRTTMNISCPWWMDWFHGGLHFQLEHHLFPRMPRRNLRACMPYVKALCKETGNDYLAAPFFESCRITTSGLERVALKVWKQE